MSAPEFTPGF